MKVIFLDFDGVLNSDKYIRECGHTGVVIDPEKMEYIKEIVDCTDAKIVLTTSWKEHWSESPDRCDDTGRLINTIFGRYGLKIYGKTPVIRPDRENEIKKWLEDNPEAEGYVVLDDMRLSADFLTGHVIKTSAFRDALKKEDVNEAIRILNG